ncbi:MAG TPA: adenylate/guanylate cyclase domain-containing protein [Syntrophales bacterium]|nr:adenylate/guanylate cyclase domain-containing protein [Syntrophales bacterium]
MTERGKKKRKPKVRSEHVLQGILAGLIVGILLILVMPLGFNKYLELMTLDMRYRLRPEITILPEIGYIDYDDASLELYGKWPWPRSRQVELVKTLDFYDVRSAGYDVFFIENEDVVFKPYMLRKYLTGQDAGGNVPAIAPLLSESFRDSDREFAEAIRKAGNIYLGFFSHDPSDKAAEGGFAGVLKETSDRRKGFSLSKKQAMEELEKGFLDTPEKWKAGLYKTTDMDPPLPGLTGAARGVGFAQPGYDRDSIVRNYIFFRFYNGKTIYAITLKMLSHILDFNLNEIESAPDGSIVLKNAIDYRTGARKDIMIPADENFQTMINWAGKYDRTFLHIPFKLLNHYYAYITAKGIARGFTNPSAKDMPAIRESIFLRIMNEKIVNEEAAGEIADEIAAAQVASAYLKRGVPAGTVVEGLLAAAGKSSETARLTKVVGIVAEAERMAKVVAGNASINFDDFTGLKSGAGTKTDPEHLKEAFKNIKWFAAKGRLKDAAPYYFPPQTPVINNGKLTPFSPVDLEGKIFMIGLTGSHTIDLRPTPFENSAPMVAYHVNALNTVLTNNFLRFPPAYYKYVITIFLALLTGLIGSVFSLPVSIPLSALYTGAYLFTTYKLWELHGQWLEWAAPLEGIFFTYLTIIVMQFVRAFREKRQVRGIFSTMVSPAVLKVMEENPDKFSLTGERKPATTLFSKIDGIGSVTKSVAPDELTHLLGFYLTPNSEIIMDYDGYIDKYEGHVIMADFGVPLDDADNPWKCAFATVEQKLDIEAFNYFVLAKYGLKVGVSMGFNSGYVSAGNMGSERKFQYTVMGDPVNVAARFMAANFIYESPNSLTGEETEPLIRDYVHLRLLDKLLLKGKTKPIRIFDVMGWKPDAYLKLRGNRPVPDFLENVWGRCPPAKIFGYHRFWSREYARNGHTMAKDIMEFFGASLDAAAILMLNEWKKEIEEYQQRIAVLTGRNGSALNRPPGVTLAGERPDYRGVLEDWTDALKALSAEAREESGRKDVAEATAREIKILLSKIELLKLRLDSDVVSEERILQAIESLKGYIVLVSSGQEAGTEQLERMLGEGRKKYVHAVADFFKTIKERKERYHEMMSLTGAPEAKSLEAAHLFDEGLQFYWGRQWDAALEKFRAAEFLSPGEGPLVSFIKRTEMYRTNPPGPNWQGEYVQTKK